MSYMDLPCIKKLDKFLSELSNNSERVICINFPTSLYKVILFLNKKKSKNRIIRINTGILSNMKQKIKEFYH